MGAIALSYQNLVDIVKDEIGSILADPDAAIGVTKMLGERPQFTIISDRFDGKTQKERQDMFWPALKERLDADVTRIASLLARTWDEVR